MNDINLPNSQNIKKIYFVGIKGVGMVGLALIAKQAGFSVVGSDVSEEFLTDSVLQKFGIHIDNGFDESYLDVFSQGNFGDMLVITTAAHNGLSNPQCVYAARRNVSILTHGQAVGYFMKGDLFQRKFDGISVLGCHGKTTISAFASYALAHVSLDPTYTVGTSEIFPAMYAGHFGNGDYFVAEADEFVSDVKIDNTVKFLYQFPKIAIVNNIDFDHPDVYKDLSEVIRTFKKFCLENILENGVLIANGDDKNVLEILSLIHTERKDVEVITYGEGEACIFTIKNFKEEGLGSVFEVYKKGELFGEFKLSIPGFYNAKNVLSVISLLDYLGISSGEIIEAIKDFKGTKRRQEEVGTTKSGMIVLDDYAHHPDEIEKTLMAIKRAFPNKKIIAMFQPHTITRTESLKNEFVNAFSSADEVIFLPIFTSKREGELDYSQLYKHIEDGFRKLGVSAVFLPDRRTETENSPYFSSQDRQPVIEYIQSHFGSEEYVLVTLGAGDIYKLSYDLVEK